MTRNESIALLTATTLDDTIGVGGYSDSAAYKLANGDISASTPGLTDDLRIAIETVGDLNFEEIDR